MQNIDEPGEVHARMPSCPACPHTLGLCTQPSSATAIAGDSSAVLAELEALKAQVKALNDLLQTAVPSLPSSPARSEM